MSIDENNSKLAATFKNISLWLDDHGLDLETNKTKAMFFTRKYKMHFPTSITLNNVNISTSKEIKFLGLVLDTKLNWKSHINNLSKKCENKINILKTITNSSWGADTPTCLLIHRAFVRPHLDYGGTL